VALSGPVDPHRLEEGIRRLRSWGNPVLCARNLASSSGYLAGSDAERLGGLEDVLAGGARVIVAARGGYGATRLLRSMPWSELGRAGACLVGFSDLTAVLNPLAARGGGVQVHGPMVAAGLAHRDNAERLGSLLRGELVGRQIFAFGDSSVVRHGRARGRSVGGNLAVLTALMGTQYEVDLEGKILFLEDVCEPRYRLDRMLTQLAASATFPGVKALISGDLHRCRPAAERMSWWRERLLEVAPRQAAVVTGLPFGHGTANMAFPIGGEVEVDSRSGRVTWRV
jgi:muramoyltetrapeptide carboxypeptidase